MTNTSKMNMKCRAAYFLVLGNYAMNSHIRCWVSNMLMLFLAQVFDFYGIWHEGQEVDYVAEFVLLAQNSSFYEVHDWYQKFGTEFILCGIHIRSDYNLFFVGTLSNSALLALRTKDALPMYTAQLAVWDMHDLPRWCWLLVAVAYYYMTLFIYWRWHLMICSGAWY